MKMFTCLIFTLLFSFYVSANDCEQCRYLSPIFDSVVIETVKFGEGLDYEDNIQELYMDIYTPYGDTVTNRPVLIFAFGGGFVQGSRTDSYVRLICNRFAELGYVAVAIDYRIGINFLTGALDPTGEAMRLFFRPMQDMRASIQHMKYSYAEQNNIYGIDTSNIFIGGGSAGAITALMVAYCDSESKFSDLGNINSINNLGGFYSTTSPHTDYNWDITGVINIAGAILRSDWIEPHHPPVYSAHGDQDQIVPYKDDIPVNDLWSLLNVQMEGSYIVDSVATARGVCSHLNTLEGEDHPTNNKPMMFYEKILIDAYSRFYSILNHKTFCCDLSVEVTPSDDIYACRGDELAITFEAEISDTTDLTNAFWCASPCTGYAEGNTLEANPEVESHYIFIASNSHCAVFDFTSIISLDEAVTANFSESVNGLQVEFNNNSSEAEDYYWNFGDGKYSFEANPVHLYNDTGTYTVQLIAANNCFTDTISKEISITPTFIYNRDFTAPITVFPNPADDFIYLDLPENKNFLIEIFSTDGKLVYQSAFSGERKRFDIATFKSGVYFVIATQDDETYTGKIIVL